MTAAIKKTAAKPAAKKTTETKVNLDNQLMVWKGKARETNANVITAGKVAGKERWFVKAQIADNGGKIDIKGDIATITATRREFRYRGMEELASIAK